MQKSTVIAALLLFAALAGVSLHAQDSAKTVGTQRVAQAPPLQTRWQALDGDSMRVECVLPRAAGRPAVIVLCDRYGMQENVRATLRVLGALGYRACAIPLLSAPERPFTGIPDAAIDSADIARVTRAAVDMANEEGGNGSVFLLGYDVGADVAIEIIARFPFYRGAVLFYPAGGLPALQRLLDAQCRIQLHVAQFDPDCTLAEVNELRETFIERGRRLHVFYYKDARRFFFNPQHPDYHKANTQKAWNQINKFFRYQ